ncbi:putative fasciclin-like arabinogalactan protein 20 [Prosopis cineraria]|uniref:putative fasciclin-like arabinogalactan protein 20 n=1 Tax=Prosopis cineraria TaxID=364024 RepID=UPI00240FE14C|nr:putative fasciclin-like arabinogalactan protein 20 [Prosopis cineraria]
MASSLQLLLLFSLCFFSLSSSVPYEAILDAADILFDSGFISMALTIEVVAKTLFLQSPSLTIFAPSDSAFGKTGQPSLDLLRFHVAPMPLPAQSLRLLPSGAKIPTMFDKNSLVVTTPPSDRRISLNNVRVNISPIYDDGFMIIYGIERFFDPNFRYVAPHRRPHRNPACGATNETVSSRNSLKESIKTLNSGGYSVMASFLGMQMSIDETPMTVFAPADNVVVNHLGNFSDYPSFFLRHVVPCKLLWNDLVDFSDGSEIPTYLDGFSINVSRLSGALMLNGAQVFIPNMFYNDELVVHGVNHALATHEKTQEVAESSSNLEAKPDDEETMFDPGEF